MTTHQFLKFGHELGTCINLSTLDLSSNKLCAGSANIVGRIIAQHGEKRDECVWLYGLRNDKPPADMTHKGLCELDLSKNELGNLGAEELYKVLSRDNWLRSLNLRSNNLELTGCLSFVKLLSKNNTLLSLDLRDNPGFNRKLSQAILEKLSSNMDLFKKNLEDNNSTEHQRADPPLSTIGITGSSSLSPVGHKKSSPNSKKIPPVVNVIPVEREGGAKIGRGNVAKTVAGKTVVENSSEDEVERGTGELRRGLKEAGRESEVVDREKKLSRPQTGKRRGGGVANGSNLQIPSLKQRKNGLSDKIRQIDPRCPDCVSLDKKLLKAESRIINLCIENAKLRTALAAAGGNTNSPQGHAMNGNSWGAIQAHCTPEEGPLAQAANLLADPRLDKRDIDPGVLMRIDDLVAELTRLMEFEGPGNRDRTIAIQQNLTTSASGIYNNTVNLEHDQLGDNASGELRPILPENAAGGGEPSRIEVVDAEDPNDNTDDVNFLPRINAEVEEVLIDGDGIGDILNQRILDGPTSPS